MFTYLIQSSSCLIILYGIYHFFLAEMTFFRHNRAYLLMAISMSLLIPVLARHVFLPPEVVPVLHWSYIAAEVNVISEYSDAESYSFTGILMNVLALIYIIGICMVLAKMMLGVFKIVQYYRSGHISRGNKYRIVNTEAVHLPFSFFQCVFISKHIPLQNHIQTILDHEEIHIRQWHTADVLFAELVHAFFWFNPVMIFYKRALRKAHEYLADDMICRNKSVGSYTELLLSKSQSGIELALTNQFFHSQIKNRIKMMTTNKTNNVASWKYALVLPIFGTLIFFFSCKEVPQMEPLGENKNVAEQVAEIKNDEPYNEIELENVNRIVEDNARFPGCEQINDITEKENCAKGKMLNYIYENLKYPSIAKAKGIEGQCVAQFIVNTDGSIENIKIVRDIGGGCSEAVRNLLSSMNELPEKWIPGKQGGKTVKVLYTLPIKFKLEDDKSISNDK